MRPVQVPVVKLRTSTMALIMSAWDNHNTVKEDLVDSCLFSAMESGSNRRKVNRRPGMLSAALMETACTMVLKSRS